MLFRIEIILFASVLLVGLLQGCSDSGDSSHRKKQEDQAVFEARTAAIEVNERQTETFNKMDADGTASEYNYPFTRLDIGQVQVFETLEIYRDVHELVIFPGLIAVNWDHSAWDNLEAVQASPNKVHVAGRFSRIDKDGNRYSTADTLRIVTKQDDHWGIKISSSYIQSTIEEGTEISDEEIAAAERAAKKVVEQYLERLNNRDYLRLAELNHYPHVMLLDIDLQVLDTPEEFSTYAESDVFTPLDYAEWNHSELSGLDVVQSSANKVHLAINYTHFDVSGKIIGEEEGVWVVTQLDDSWRIRARSML